MSDVRSEDLGWLAADHCPMRRESAATLSMPRVAKHMTNSATSCLKNLTSGYTP